MQSIESQLAIACNCLKTRTFDVATRTAELKAACAVDSSCGMHTQSIQQSFCLTGMSCWPGAYSLVPRIRMHMYPLFLSLSLSTRRRTQLARAGAPCAKCSCAHARQQLWLTHVYITWRVTPFWIPDGDIDVITVLPLQPRAIIYGYNAWSSRPRRSRGEMTRRNDIRLKKEFDCYSWCHAPLTRGHQGFKLNRC